MAHLLLRPLPVLRPLPLLLHMVVFPEREAPAIVVTDMWRRVQSSVAEDGGLQACAFHFSVLTASSLVSLVSRRL